MNATVEEVETRYYGRSVLDDFTRHGQRYGALPVTWFVSEREGEETDSVREETMTKEEADAVADYLSRVHREMCELDACEFGEDDCVSRARPYGERSGCNTYLLHTESRYDLPFKVCGYFDFRAAEDVTDVGNAFEVGATS